MDVFGHVEGEGYILRMDGSMYSICICNWRSIQKVMVGFEMNRYAMVIESLVGCA